MEYIIFYVSLALILVAFLISIYIKPFTLSNLIIGITTISYSLIYEMAFSDRLKLYYYINPKDSNLYVLLSGIFIYPLLNIMFTLFLPVKIKRIVVYTLFWIIFMLLFEYINLTGKTIVFTGWKPIPWSIVTYLITYTWIIYFYSYLLKKIKEVENQ